MVAAGMLFASSTLAQPYPCDFRSYAVNPPHPAANQPFTVTVTVFAQCPSLFTPETESNVVTVPIDCYCAIGTPPPPYLYTIPFVVDGLQAGLATVQFVPLYTSDPVYSFSLTIGSPLEVPALEGSGLLLFALLLLISAAVVLRWRR